MTDEELMYGDGRPALKGIWAQAMVCNPRIYRLWLKKTKPSLYMLMSACWASGYTVNGLKPQVRTA